MLLKVKHTILGLLVLYCHLGWTHNVQYKNYTVDNGLLSSEVFHIIQDSNGYIWIATDQGVNKFDGYTFSSYTNLNGLPDKTVLELYEDYKGRIWFIPLSAVLSYYQNDSIITYKYNNVIKAYNSKKHYPIKKSFYVDTLDNLYIGFYNKNILRIDSSGVLHEIKPKEKGLSKFHLADNEKLLYSSIRNKKGLITFQNPYKQNEVIVMDCKTRGDRLFAVKDDQYIICTYFENSYRIAPTGKYRKKTLESDIIWISKDSHGYLWTGFMNNGVKAYTSGLFEKSKYRFLDNLSVSSVCMDHEQGLWLSTLENGIYYYPSLNFRLFDPGSKLKNRKVHNLEVADNQLWIHYDGGFIVQYSPNEIKHFNYPVSNKLLSNTLFHIKGDSIFSSNGRSGLYLINNGYKTLLSKDTYKNIVIASNNDILLFRRWNIYQYKNGALSFIFHSDKYSIVYAIKKTGPDRFLLGTDVGLFTFDYKKRSISPTFNDKLMQNRINCIHFDSDSTLFVGTKAAGVIIIKNDKIHQLTVKDGISGNSVNSIDTDENYVWLSTNKGITRFEYNNGEIDKESIDIFNSGHGLGTNEIKDIKVYKNDVFAATSNGLYSFRKDIKSYHSEAKITHFKANGTFIKRNSPIILNHNQNNINIGFLTINYQRNSPIKYLYRLIGLDTIWQNTSDLDVSFSSLPPGNYTFEVSAINNHGKYSKSLDTISFVIKEPYYQTTFFLLLVIAVVLAIVSTILYAFFKTKLKEAAKRSNIELELNKSRQQALNAQMNPHFIYNSLTSVQSFILKNDRFSSSQYLSKLGNMMRSVLNNSQKEFISLTDEIEALKEYIDLELVRFRDGFEYKIEIDPDLNISHIMVPPLIIQPYVENAIHHGLILKQEDKKLQIKIFKNNSRIHIQVIDNGIGIENHKKKYANLKKYHKSKGNDITKKRLILFDILYSNQLEIKTTEAFPDDKDHVGTLVDISFSIHGISKN